MANSKSAKKRVLVAAKTALSVAYKELDKAVSKGILKKNTASRKKARLAAKVNSL